MKTFLKKVMNRENLSVEEITSLMDNLVLGHYSDIQIAGFLVALEMKGVTVQELTAAARVMRKSVKPIFESNDEFIDIMSTGGSAAKPFNVSTTAMFIAAGAGASVAKHTQRSVHSHCGSSDVLEALGVNVNVPIEKVPLLIEKIGLGFCFSPSIHPSMKFLAPSRRSLGVRTIFDLLAPMSNPAKAKRQVIGVYSKEALHLMAESFVKLGDAHVMLVHGSDGMDEITTTADTQVIEVHGKEMISYTILPEDFKLKRAQLSELIGKDPVSNAQIICDILDGKKGPKTDIALVNSAAVIYLSGKSKNLQDGFAMAKESVQSGKAKKKLEELKSWTQKVS